MPLITDFDAPSFDGGMYLCWKNNAGLDKGVDYAFAKKALESAIFAPPPRRYPVFFTFAVEIDMCLALGDLSSVRCGIGLPRIAYSIDSQNMPNAAIWDLQ